MKIYILEDNGSRNKLFKAWFGEKHDLHMHLDATDESKKELQEEKFDVIFLDHDLGDRAMVDSNDPNTGYQVCKVLPGSINKDTPVIIHSMNPQGAVNIYDELKGGGVEKVYHIPFGSFDETVFTERLDD